MKIQTEQRRSTKEKEGKSNTPTTVRHDTEPEEDDKAWNLAQQLKARMKAMHGGGRNGKNAIKEKRKANYKRSHGMDSDESTPSEFDPNDSEWDEDMDGDSESD